MISVHLNQIPTDSTLSLSGEIPLANLGPLSLKEAGVEPVGPLHYELEVGLSDGGLFATGKLSLRMKATCVSCLEPFEYELQIPDFALQKELAGPRLVRPLSKLAASDAEQGATAHRRGVYKEILDEASTGATQLCASAVEFGKRSIDLTPEVREDIHLLLPMHPRCTLGGNKCPAQFPQRVVPSSKNSEVRSVWAALDNITHL